MEIIWPAYLNDINKFKVCFLYHLNKVYCAKAHLLERLPEIVDQTYFKDLNLAILELIDDLEKQLTNVEKIYQVLDISYSLEDCKYMISFIEEAFVDIQQQHDNPILRDMAILFYLQNIEALEISSFKIMVMMSGKLNNVTISQLLVENLDEAKEASKLLLMISEKYLID